MVQANDILKGETKHVNMAGVLPQELKESGGRAPYPMAIPRPSPAISNWVLSQVASKLYPASNHRREVWSVCLCEFEFAKPPHILRPRALGRMHRPEALQCFPGQFHHVASRFDVRDRALPANLPDKTLPCERDRQAEACVLVHPLATLHCMSLSYTGVSDKIRQERPYSCGAADKVFWNGFVRVTWFACKTRNPEAETQFSSTNGSC